MLMDINTAVHACFQLDTLCKWEIVLFHQADGPSTMAERFHEKEVVEDSRPRLVICPSSAVILAKTSRHWSRLLWRKSLCRGYHGESSRPRSQRQSGTNGSASQTGTPSAPARCASAVSQ